MLCRSGHLSLHERWKAIFVRAHKQSCLELSSVDKNKRQGTICWGFTMCFPSRKDPFTDLVNNVKQVILCGPFRTREIFFWDCDIWSNLSCRAFFPFFRCRGLQKDYRQEFGHQPQNKFPKMSKETEESTNHCSLYIAPSDCYSLS